MNLFDRIPLSFQPKLVTVLREGYGKKTFISDLVSGIIVGIVALPLAIAFGIASGVKPEQGLYSAVAAGIVVSLLSGSRTQISGPTGAFIVIIYGIVQSYGYDGLAIATLLAGVFLVVLGLVGFGMILRFIPYSLTVGFTSGIALIILAGQIKDFFGLTASNVPADFLPKLQVLAAQFHTFNPNALGVAVLSLLVIIFWQKLGLKVPGTLAAVLISTVVVSVFHLPVETIGSRFGSVPNTLPVPALPNISWAVAVKMFSPAFTIAILAAIESLLSAVVADGMMGTRHRSNMELIAQGAGNIVSPLFGGIPVTGAIARTATNIKNGGKTPVSGLVHALTLVVIILFFAPYASLIPMACLAAILVFVAYNMGEWHAFFKTLKAPAADKLILLNTFLLTLFIDLTVAIEVGLVLAALSFMKKMSDVTEARLMTEAVRASQEGVESSSKGRGDIPPEVEVFEVYGTLFFGAVDQFREALRQLEKPPRIIILETSHLVVIDGSGLKALEDLCVRLEKEKASLFIAGIHKQPLFELSRSGIIDRVGEQNVFGGLDEAIAEARNRLKK